MRKAFIKDKGFSYTKEFLQVIIGLSVEPMRRRLFLKAKPLSFFPTAMIAAKVKKRPAKAVNVYWGCRVVSVNVEILTASSKTVTRAYSLIHMNPKYFIVYLLVRQLPYTAKAQKFYSRHRIFVLRGMANCLTNRFIFRSMHSGSEWIHFVQKTKKCKIAQI